jgi:hypothetical protein
MFVWNAVSFSMDYTVLYLKDRTLHNHCCRTSDPTKFMFLVIAPKSFNCKVIARATHFKQLGGHQSIKVTKMTCGEEEFKLFWGLSTEKTDLNITTHWIAWRSRRSRNWNVLSAIKFTMCSWTWGPRRTWWSNDPNSRITSVTFVSFFASSLKCNNLCLNHLWGYVVFQQWCILSCYHCIFNKQCELKSPYWRSRWTHRAFLL